MTLDDQIEALEPLTPGVIAALLEYSNLGQLRVQRSRGATIPAGRLRRAAERLRVLADTAESLAANSSEQPS